MINASSPVTVLLQHLPCVAYLTQFADPRVSAAYVFWLETTSIMYTNNETTEHRAKCQNCLCQKINYSLWEIRTGTERTINSQQSSFLSTLKLEIKLSWQAVFMLLSIGLFEMFFSYILFTIFYTYNINFVRLHSVEWDEVLIWTSISSAYMWFLIYLYNCIKTSTTVFFTKTKIYLWQTFKDS